MFWFTPICSCAGPNAMHAMGQGLARATRKKGGLTVLATAYLQNNQACEHTAARHSGARSMRPTSALAHRFFDGQGFETVRTRFFIAREGR